MQCGKDFQAHEMGDRVLNDELTNQPLSPAFAGFGILPCALPRARQSRRTGRRSLSFTHIFLAEFCEDLQALCLRAFFSIMPMFHILRLKTSAIENKGLTDLWVKLRDKQGDLYNQSAVSLAFFPK
jgi:hypothetical protein